jgi:hypothetical protein
MSGQRHAVGAESGRCSMAAKGLTARMRYALRLMYESSEERMAVTVTQPTRPLLGPSAFVNLRTARALEDAGLACFEYGGGEPTYEWFSLTDAGRELAGTLPESAELAS